MCEAMCVLHPGAPPGRGALRGKSLLMTVKEESEKSGLKLNIQKTKIMASSLITSWQIVGETMETMTDFSFWAPKSLQMADGDCSHEIKRSETWENLESVLGKKEEPGLEFGEN